MRIGAALKMKVEDLWPRGAGWRNYSLSREGRGFGARQEMAGHESPRTTKLYDRTKEQLTHDEVERIRL